MRLYRSTMYPARWYAHTPEAGFVMFPAQAGGWDKRQPARGFDPIDVREVPVRLAFEAGIPGAPDVPAEISDLRLPEAA